MGAGGVRVARVEARGVAEAGAAPVAVAAVAAGFHPAGAEPIHVRGDAVHKVRRGHAFGSQRGVVVPEASRCGRCAREHGVAEALREALVLRRGVHPAVRPVDRAERGGAVVVRPRGHLPALHQSLQ